MTTRIALTHRTHYRFSTPAVLGPHLIRLRPSHRTRATISAYELEVRPVASTVHWQDDAAGNTVARVALLEPTTSLDIVVTLTADLQPINPFDFLVDAEAATFPFTYSRTTAAELAPCLAVGPGSPAIDALVAAVRSRAGTSTVDVVTDLARTVARDVAYRRRETPGIQTPAETLDVKSGSCRDSAWLLVDLLRRIGIAARFVSGYLIQLATATTPDHAELHAWAECYVPGAGWIGLDATSGLLTAEGHIPLAVAADPRDAAPVEGTHSPADAAISVDMTIARVDVEPPLSTPIDDAAFDRLLAAGDAVDARLAADGVRLTMGGEPTFVARADPDAVEWTLSALGPTKAAYADRFARRLQARFAAGGLIHHGHGKWYPGEPIARWAYAIVWRTDGEVLWRDVTRIATDPDPTAPHPAVAGFARALCGRLGLAENAAIPVFEDPMVHIIEEALLPPGLTPEDMRTAPARARLARVLDHPLGEPVGVALPLTTRATERGHVFATERWSVRRTQLFLLPGDGPLGLRLPLSSLPDATSVRTALTIAPRPGHVVVFLPPLGDGTAYARLIAAIEATAEAAGTQVRLEGYLPPDDPSLRILKVTPDPGVIEINVHPASTWRETADITAGVYEDAHAIGLTAQTFGYDGGQASTGGGNHIVVGGALPQDSPFLRRPDLLASIITYWQAHPALSFAFAGRFVGPTSQSPRIDEGRHDALREIEIAMAQIPEPGTPIAPSLVDRLFRHLLVDITGNTHRAEICIDKLAAPDGAMGRLGLVEFRAIEMSPDARMAIAIQLLIRALIAMLWARPFRRRLSRWGTHLHDRFMLPHVLEADFADVLADLHAAGLPLDARWFAPQLTFRFPTFGQLRHRGIDVTLRQALEPWPVLGEDGSGGTSRPVDATTDRLEVLMRGDASGRHGVACNGRLLPLVDTGLAGERLAGVRFRVWPSTRGYHPLIAPHVPLTFDLVDLELGRAVASARYHATPRLVAGASAIRPKTAGEARALRATRFEPIAPTPAGAIYSPVVADPEYPMTLDLRRPIAARR